MAADVAEISKVDELARVVLERPAGLRIVLLNLTTWCIALVILHARTSRYFDLHLLTRVVLLLALFVSYVRPGYLKYRVLAEKGNGPAKEYRIVGRAKFVLDVLLHVAPFAYVHYTVSTGEHGTDWLRAANTVLLLLAYVALVDTVAMYDVDRLALSACVLGVCVLTVLRLSLP